MVVVFDAVKGVAMIESQSSNLFLLALLKRLQRHQRDLETIPFKKDSLNTYAHRYNALANEYLRLLDNITASLKKQKSLSDAELDVAIDSGISDWLSESHAQYLNNARLSAFYGITELNKQLLMISKPLTNYIKTSDIKVRIHEKLLKRFLKTTNEIKNEFGEENVEINILISRNQTMLIDNSFNDILKDRNAIIRYQKYQSKEVQSSLNRVFSPFFLWVKIIISPFSLWRKDTLKMMGYRVALRTKLIKQMQRNDCLCQIALEKNVDVFIRRWLFCTSTNDLSKLSDMEYESIRLYMKTPLFLAKISKHYILPLDIKRLITSDPIAAFTQMVHINSSHRAGDFNVRRDKNSHDGDVRKRTSFHQLEKLVTKVEALFEGDKASKLYQKESPIVLGILINAKKAPIFYSNTKRLKALSSYLRIFNEIQHFIQEVNIDSSMIDQHSLDALQRIREQCHDFYQAQRELINESSEKERIEDMFLSIVQLVDRVVVSGDEEKTNNALIS